MCSFEFKKTSNGKNKNSQNINNNPMQCVQQARMLNEANSSACFLQKKRWNVKRLLYLEVRNILHFEVAFNIRVPLHTRTSFLSQIFFF